MLECVLYTKEFNKIYHWIVLAIRLKTNLHYLTRSIEIVAMYKYFESVHKGEILLVDQGILQNTISLIYLNEIEDIYFFENHFCALGRRCGQPGQQHGRRLPLSKSAHSRARCSFRVSAFLTIVTKHIHSLRARGGSVFHIFCTLGDRASASFISLGTLCTGPSVTAVFGI